TASIRPRTRRRRSSRSRSASPRPLRRPPPLRGRRRSRKAVPSRSSRCSPRPSVRPRRGTPTSISSTTFRSRSPRCWVRPSCRCARSSRWGPAACSSSTSSPPTRSTSTSTTSSSRAARSSSTRCDEPRVSAPGDLGAGRRRPGAARAHVRGPHAQSRAHRRRHGPPPRHRRRVDRRLAAQRDSRRQGRRPILPDRRRIRRSHAHRRRPLGRRRAVHRDATEGTRGAARCGAPSAANDPQTLVNRRLLTVLFASAVVVAVAGFAVPALAQGVPGPTAPTVPIPHVNIGVTPATKPSDVAMSLQILLLLTVLTLAPTLLVLMTSFTRIVVVLSFVRTALGTNTVPPTQVLVGLALLLTFFVMNPVIQDINKNALQPYL